MNAFEIYIAILYFKGIVFMFSEIFLKGIVFMLSEIFLELQVKF